MVDMHLMIATVATALFNLTKTTNQTEDILDKKILAQYESKVYIAEANIISVMKFDFSVELPNQTLMQLSETEFRNDPGVQNMAKVLQLELFRSGASLFFGIPSMTVASFLLAHYLVHSEITRQLPV